MDQKKDAEANVRFDLRFILIYSGNLSNQEIEDTIKVIMQSMRSGPMAWAYKEWLKEERPRKPIDQLGLSVRTENCLKAACIYDIDELIKKSEIEVLKIINIGNKSLKEIKDSLEALDLVLEG